MINPQYLLDDEQMQQFISQGYLTLKSSLPASLHQTIYDKTEDAFGKEGNPGNNILPRVPEMQQIFDDPVLDGALSSVLGPNYIMHAHRHPHINPANSKGGGWHKDSYWGYRKVRYHRSRWAMIFYYPQDVTTANGPTAVMPGTQFYNDRAADAADEMHLPVCGAAGTATLVHFDLWHRAMPNTTENNRYMMKFQFTRMQEPDQPSWNNSSAQWPGNGSGEQSSTAVWSRLWDWHRGADGPSSGSSSDGIGALVDALQAVEDGTRLRAVNELGALGPEAGDAVAALVGALRDAAEPVRLNAAYALGAIGEDAVPALMQVLEDEDETARLEAAYGLGTVGKDAVPALIEGIGDRRDHVRAYAAYALGDMGAAAGVEAAVALASLAQDESEEVRVNASEALGTIAANAAVAVPALATLMEDENGQVRYNAAYALAHFGPEAAPAVPQLIRGLADENRYVLGHSTTALQRIGAPEAQQGLLDFLLTSRWCPLTNKETTF